MGVKKWRKLYVLGALVLAVALIVVEEILDAEFLGEALLGLVCIALLGTSMGGTDREHPKTRGDEEETTRRLSDPTF